MVILDIKKPKKCIWYEDGQDCKCPLLDDNDCCRGQGNEANSAANDWDDLMKGCPIKGVLPDEHGDLIDRDKFVDKYIRHYTEQERKMNLVFAAVEVKQDFADMIYEEDAVIAAERKDDEQID